MMEIIRTQDKINEQLNKAMDAQNEGSKFFGVSDEEGIVAMYDWLVGNIVAKWTVDFVGKLASKTKDAAGSVE